MWDIFPQSGLTTTVLDFTDDFSLLLIGLVSLLWLSAGTIVWMAIRHSLSQKVKTAAETRSSVTNHQDAA